MKKGSLPLPDLAFEYCPEGERVYGGFGEKGTNLFITRKVEEEISFYESL